MIDTVTASRPLWSILDRRDEFDQPDLPLLTVVSDYGVGIRDLAEGRAPSEDLSGYRVVRPGDLVVNKMWARFGAYGVAQVTGVISPAYWTLVPRPDLVWPRFLHYLLRSEPYRAEIWRRSKDMPPNGFDIPWEQFRTIEIPVLPLVKQRTIANYLDRETARIDGVIDKKRRMIELLEEQTHAWSVRLVLGDLGDTKGSISPSGLYRVVPEGWIETALRHLNCRVQTGPFGSQLHADEYIEGGWPVVNPMNLVEGEIRAVESMTVSDHKRAELERHILAPGDIVFGRRGEMGRAGLADDAHRGWLCGTGSLRLRLRSKLISPTYLKLLLETPVARAYFELASIGSTMDNLSSEIVLAMPTLVPPIETQDRIVESVQARRETAKVLRQLLERQIGMLQEHRQAVITAAVTGELETPGVAA